MQNIELNSRLKHLTEVLNQKITVFRSAGTERKQLALWEQNNGVDILGLIDILGSSVQGWVSRLSESNAMKSIAENELSQMENIDPFNNITFSQWYLENRHSYPKLTRCVIALEFTRQELLDIIHSYKSK